MAHCTASPFHPILHEVFAMTIRFIPILKLLGHRAADRWAGVLRRSADPRAASADRDPGRRAEADPLRAACRDRADASS